MNDNHCVDCGKFAPTGMTRCWKCSRDYAEKWYEETGHKEVEKLAAVRNGEK